MKRLCADDSAATSVKVGYRQASYIEKARSVELSGLFAFRSPDRAFDNLSSQSAVQRLPDKTDRVS